MIHLQNVLPSLLANANVRVFDIRSLTWATEICQLKMNKTYEIPKGVEYYLWTLSAVFPFVKFVSSPCTLPFVHTITRLSGFVYFLPHIIRHKLQ